MNYDCIKKQKMYYFLDFVDKFIQDILAAEKVFYSLFYSKLESTYLPLPDSYRFSILGKNISNITLEGLKII